MTISAEAIEQRLTQGVLNAWYPVLPSWGVTDRPVGITRLSEHLVLWRDQDGQIHALEDRCPHRGARLSLGWNLGNRLACWYHGIEVDHAGTIIDVPAMENCPLIGQQRTKPYPVAERNGAIFVYFGDHQQSSAPPLTLPEQLSNTDNFEALLCTARWRCNYLYAIDNVMDPMHGAYLHAKSHSMAKGDKRAVMQVRTTEHGLICEKANQSGVNFDWVEFADTDALWLRLEIPYGAGAGPGGPFGIVGFVTPVDKDHCQVFFWRTRKVTGWQRDLWRFMYKTRLEELHWQVLEQDRILLENLAPDAREHEALYQHDTGLVRVRRILKERIIKHMQQQKTQTHSDAAD